MADRDEVIRSAMSEANDDQRTGDGRPTMEYLNARLEAEGHEKATADERDRAFEAQHENDGPIAEGETPRPATANSVGEVAPEPTGAVVAGAPPPNQQSGGAAPIGGTTDEDGNTTPGMPPAEASRLERATAAAVPSERSVQSPGVEPSGKTAKIRLVYAQTTPVVVYVHGVGQFRLPVDPNLEQEVPLEVLEVLRNGDAQFEEVR